MKLLLSFITFFISHIYFSEAQVVVVAFTPNTIIFAFPEDERTLGSVYLTSNVNINPVYSSTYENLSISNNSEVSLIELLDYESERIFFSDVQEDSYNISADLIFCILDVNDNTPTSPLPTSLIINTPETNLNVSDFTMRFYSDDLDSNINGIVTFTLVDNGIPNNNSLFRISSDGILENIVSLKQNIFTIIVQATDGGSPALSSQTNFTLTLNTRKGTYLDRYTSFVEEDIPIGAFIGTLPFTGPFHINITRDAYVEYNQTTGDLIVMNSFDFEYDAEVHLDLLNDSNMFITELVIYVINVVESAPEFLTSFPEELSVLSIAGSIVYCPDVYVLEENPILTFELVNGSSIFSIDSDNGIITLTRSIVYDTPRVYNITLRVTDRGVSNLTTISLLPAYSDIPLPSQPQSLIITLLTNAIFSTSWQEPVGLFPSHIFTRGYLYEFTYFSLSNVSNILTQYTYSNFLNISLFAGPVHLFLVQASLLNDQYGDNVITSYVDTFITATTVNSSVIQVSFYQLDFCGNDSLHIEYEIEYYGMFNDPTSRSLFVNVTQQTDNIMNITSCFPDSVYLTNLTSATNYVINLYVTIQELDVYSVLIARNVSNFTDPIVVAFTPNTIIFAFPEDERILGSVYLTSNVNINPVYSSTYENLSISNNSEVSLIELLDYESERIFFSDVQEDSYNISADLIFCILDVNDNTPTSPLPTSLIINTPETYLNVSAFTMRFYSDDLDSNINGNVTFMLIDNGIPNNNSLFRISSDGILKNIVSLRQNIFTIIVQATDGGSPALSSQTNFTLTLNTRIGTYLNRYTSFVREDIPIGAVGTLPFTGPFHINITRDAYLEYNQTTGDLIVMNSFDFEYDAEVHLDLLDDSNTFVTELVIYVINVVESAPEFLTSFPEELSVLSIAGSIAYCPDVYVREENPILTFELVNGSSIFSIDSNNGIISLTRSIVYDTPRVYDITLRVTDRGVSNLTTISLIPAFSDIPLPSQPQSLIITLLTNAIFFTSWQEPVGLFPSHIFTRGYLYEFTYFSLSNVSNILIQYTYSNFLNISLFAGPVHLFLVQASLLNDQYGDNVITSYVGSTYITAADHISGIFLCEFSMREENTFITATTVNSSVIQVSFYQLDFCGNDSLHIEYEIEYYGMFNDPTSRSLFVNVIQQTDNIMNITSCFPDSVYLTNLNSATNYVINLYVTIQELDVYSVLIARNVSNFTDPIDEIFKFPEYSLCIGDKIYIDCYFDDNRRSYISNGFVYFSFNGSTPISYQINSENQTENGIDLRNYNYTQEPSNLYAYLNTINGLLEQDFSITFSCHLLTNNDTFSEDVLSTRIERAVPPSSPSCNVTSVSFNEFTCQLNIMLSWPYVHVLSERNETNYTVWEDGTVILSTVSNSFNYSTILRAPETEYNLSLSAENCAGNSKRDVCYTRPVPDILSKPNCSITNTSFNGYTCSLFAVLSWRSVPSDRNATIYNVKQNGVVSETSQNILSHLYKFSRISPEFGYTLSLSAEDCAGESEDDTCYFIPGYRVKNQSLELDFDHSTGNLTLNWILDQFPVYPTEDHIIIQYSIHFQANFVGCQPPYVNNSVSVEKVIFSQISNFSNYTLNIYTPRVVSELSISVTLELVQLCHQNVTEHLPQRQSYDYLLEIPSPICNLVTVSIDPYTCRATHSFQTDSSLNTTLYYTINNNRSFIGENSFIDSQIITPNTPYSYSMTAEDCNVDSDPKICHQSTLPSYQYDLDSLSMDYVPEIDKIIFRWAFYKYPSSAPAHTIALSIRYSITLNYTISGMSDTSGIVYFDENQSLVILSNETVYEVSGSLDETDDIVVESLIITVSILIEAQCNHTMENNVPVIATYNYTIAPCQETNTCFKDVDRDGYPDTQTFCEFLNTLCVDNCPLVSNQDQSDCNANGIGDVCDTTCLPERDTTFGYNWTCTEGGQTVSQTCIEGAGNASRVCGHNGDWSSLVNTSLCFSAAFNEIKQNISIDSLTVIVAIFKNDTVPTTSGDISVIVAVLNTTIEATTNVTGEVIETILNNTLAIVDVLADDSSQTLLTQSQEDTQISQKVLNILEMQAGNLALNSQNDVKLNTSKNVFVETRTVEVSQSEGIVINANNIQEETEDTPTIRVPIPKGLNSSQKLSVSVVVMKNIGKLIQSFSDDITVGVEGIKLNNFAEFVIVSSLIAIQLFFDNELLTTDGSDTLAELSLPLSLSSIDLTRGYIKPTCLSLGNASSSNPNWEDSGILNVSADDITNGVLTCLPGHNTAFVVLVGVGNLESQTVVLNILSYIGCSLSVICLLISMVIYLLFGRNLLRKIYHFVHFKLALSLCLLYLAFLFGVEPAYANVWLYIPCKVVTVVVEYFLLVTFLWMLMEGIVVLIMIMWPFHQFNWKQFVIFSCISWGLPLIYVIPFIPFYHEYYISPPNHLNSSVLRSSAEYCFLHNDENTNLIYSITVPLAVVIIMNIVILSIVTIRCVLLIVRQKSLSKLQRTQKTALRLLRLLLVMFPVLGFGWSFGLLAIYFNTTVFAWLFTIFCAFQGILFLFLVLLLRRDIQRSIVNLLNLKSKYLTLHSRLSSYYSKPVSTRVTSAVTKQTLIFDQPEITPEPDLQSPPSAVIDLELQNDLTSASRIFTADKTGMLPPTVELEEMLMFYEERRYTRVESDTSPEDDKENTEDIFEKIAKDLEELTTQITEVDFD